jgi:uncharacterized protein
MPNNPANETNGLSHDKRGISTRLLVLSCVSAFVALFVTSPVLAQEIGFPALTGRVVDKAGLLDEQVEATLTATLAAHEAQSSNQIVVVTLSSLNGYDIADYANRLGRHWNIGTSVEDNGILLLVAPNDRKVRIEVGYGLEGALTDSLSSIIIQREILPEFKNNNFPKGILQGVAAITQAIQGEYTAPVTTASNRKTDPISEKFGNYLPLIFIAMIGIPQLLKRSGYRKASNGAFPAGFGGLVATLASGSLLIGLGIAIALFLFIYFKGSSGGGSGEGDTRTRGFASSGGFGGGGGFSGGGGSFGGGGASGSW